MNEPDADASTNDGGIAAEVAPASGFVAELRLAFSFLTILPVLGGRAASEETVAASFAWFPLVGFVLGLALCGEDAVLSHGFGQVMRSVLLVLSLTVITGAIHLDGLADTCDALGGGRNRERALEILRDSRIGTFGAAAVFFDLTLKILALATLAGSRRYAALFLAPGLARWAMYSVARHSAYLRSDGAGSVLVGRRDALHSWAPVLSATLAALFVHGLLALITAVAIVWAIRSFYRRWLGGVTGDLIGACGELVEIAVLITMS